MAAPPKPRRDAAWLRVEQPNGTGHLLAVHGAPAAALLLMAAVGWWFRPGAFGYEACRLHAWTGIACPTCGGTRVLHALVHGRFGEAVSLSPFLTLTMLVLALILVVCLVGLASRTLLLPGRNLRAGLTSRTLWIGVGVAWTVDWVYRIVTLYPA